MLLKAEFFSAPQPGSYAKQLGRVAIALFLLAITACSSQQKQPQPAEPAMPGAQPQSAAALLRWEAKGKLGVRAPRENGSANMIWQQANSNYRIHLSGPLGAGATLISGSPTGVSLQRGDEPAVFAADAGELTEQVMGWPLPVGEMFYWVRGLPAPGAVASKQANSQGLLQSLSQAGWQLRFSDYQKIGAYHLPTRIKAATNQAAGPVNVTLVIKEWLPK